MSYDPAEGQADLPATESGIADAGLDGRPNDAPTDAGEDSALDPCAPSTTMQLLADDIVGCIQPSQAPGVSQCEAASLCNRSAGWQLCSASAYRERFATVAPPLVGAWLAGCVRDAGPLHVPGNEPCACDDSSGSSALMAWKCQFPDDELITFWAHVGLKTADTCFWAGVDDPLASAFWVSEDSSTKLRAATCCYTR